jgi:glucose-6-phosphate isomerase
MVVLPYKDSLLLLSRYLQQLVMESLGKEFDLDGNRVKIILIVLTVTDDIELVIKFCFSYCSLFDVIFFKMQVNQGLTVYGNKGSTDQHA